MLVGVEVRVGVGVRVAVGVGVRVLVGVGVCVAVGVGVCFDGHVRLCHCVQHSRVGSFGHTEYHPQYPQSLAPTDPGPKDVISFAPVPGMTFANERKNTIRSIIERIKYGVLKCFCFMIALQEFKFIQDNLALYGQEHRRLNTQP